MSKATDIKRKRRKRLRKKRDEIKILQFAAPELWSPCEPVTDDDDCLWLDTMRRALMSTEHGIGIAAPQIGVLKRAFLVWPDRNGLPFEFINPQFADPLVFLEKGELRYEAEEACLSFPGYFVKTQRKKVIRLTWETVLKEPAESSFSDRAAQVIQHEMEHLDGQCCVGLAWRKAVGR